MLPPVLELVVLWHPSDRIGRDIATRLLDHFHGSTFTGLIGGAVEVFIRSQPWRERGGPPREIFFAGGDPPPNGIARPERTAVVPVLGDHLMRATQTDSRWQDYLQRIASASQARPGRVGIFPVSTGINLRRSRLDDIVGNRLWIGQLPTTEDVRRSIWVRDLVQGLTQFADREPDAAPMSAPLAGDRRLTVFISHTRQGRTADSAVLRLSSLVRSVLADSRLGSFFDAHDLQVDEDWREQLRKRAGGGALLCLRSDLYASRDWCQEEVLIAKQAGAPVVVLDALESGEERGSFLMDHTPRVPVLRAGDDWSRDDVERGLGLLVDECLKRRLWQRQQSVANSARTLDVAWWAPHAPEPVTLAHWLENRADHAAAPDREGIPLRILHPDPPLGRPEREVLDQVARLAGVAGGLDMMTPRQLASRGGG